MTRSTVRCQSLQAAQPYFCGANASVLAAISWVFYECFGSTVNPCMAAMQVACVQRQYDPLTMLGMVSLRALDGNEAKRIAGVGYGGFGVEK